MKRRRVRGPLPWRSSDGDRNRALDERSAELSKGRAMSRACFPIESERSKVLCRNGVGVDRARSDASNYEVSEPFTRDVDDNCAADTPGASSFWRRARFDDDARRPLPRRWGLCAARFVDDCRFR